MPETSDPRARATSVARARARTPRPPRAAAPAAAHAWPGLAWLRERTGRHPLTADAGLAALLLLVATFRRGELADHRALSVVLGVLLIAPLVWRRRHPFAVFGVVCVVAATQWLLGRVLVADLALLVALYTVAAHCDRRKALSAAAVIEVGVLLAVIRWAPPQGVLTGFVFLSGMATAAFVLGVNIRTRRAYLESLEDRALRAEHERDQQAQLAAASERARIAREMHDVVAHNLSVMIALADGAAFAARSNSAETEAAARHVAQTGRQALTEMHRLLGVLRNGEDSPRAPQPGIDQIDDLVAQVRTAGLPTSFTMTGRPFPLPSTAQLAVYRLIQEALTNVLKHADSPTEAKVTLHYDDPVVTLGVIDDGRGDSARHNPGSGGHGLSGMRERAAVFNGSVEAGPRQTRGWQVRATLDSGRTPSGVRS
jgi:signal transduction histidine kinase